MACSREHQYYDDNTRLKYKDEPYVWLCLNIRTMSQAASPVSYRNLAGTHSRRDERQIDYRFEKGLDNRSLPPLDSLVRTSRQTRHNMHSEHYVPPYTRTKIYKFSFFPAQLLIGILLHNEPWTLRGQQVP